MFDTIAIMAVGTLAESDLQATLIDPNRLAAADLAAHELKLQRLDAQVLAAKYRAADAVAVRPLTVTEHYRRPQQWVIFETGQSQRSVNREFRVASILCNRLPQVLTALEKAEIFRCHVDVFVSLADRKPLAEALDRDADDLLQLAKTRTFVEFEALADAWSVMMDPTDPQDIDEQAHDNRRLVWTDSVAGETHVELSVPTVDWEYVLNGLDALLEKMFADDWDAAAEQQRNEGGEAGDLGPEDLPRTDVQRRADALLQLLRRGINRPGDSGVSATVNIVVDQQTLDDEQNRQAGQPTAVRTMDDLDRYRCETSNGSQITPSQALLLAVGGHIRRVVLNAPTLEMSSKQRLFTGNLREGILLKHRWCDADGCETRSHRCQVDHVVPASRGGPTNAENGRPLCNPCHRHKTRLENLGIW